MADSRWTRERAPKPPLGRIGRIGLAIIAPLALLITLWPTHLFMEIKPEVVRGIEWLHDRDLFQWLYWTRLEVLANVAMLMPIALLLTFLLGRRRWWIAVALCVGGSLSIELVQHFMPGRVASAMDVVANSLGALLGALLAVAIEASVVRSRRPSSSHATAGEQQGPAQTGPAQTGPAQTVREQPAQR